jgi:hypothetical protein
MSKNVERPFLGGVFCAFGRRNTEQVFEAELDHAVEIIRILTRKVLKAIALIQKSINHHN